VRDSLQDAGQLRRGDLFGHDQAPWEGATIDSRTDCARRVFFALKGEQSDGHRYVEAARLKGSCAAVVDREEVVDDQVRAGAPYLLVRDALVALQELSRAYRGTLDLRVIAVTGSSGKTTTKEYVRLILRKKYKVHANSGNFNNHIGVPLTLLDTDHESEYLVCEIGANHAGEIGFLARILDPEVGVITNIGDAHLGLFGSREGIAEAKAELLDCIEPEGAAILPGDDDYLGALKRHAACRVATFGYGDSCTFRISSVTSRGESIRFRVNEHMLRMKSVGVYNLLNAAAAFAVGDVCGVEPESAREALAEAEPMPGRAQVHRGRGVVLVDDSYNANPSSMRASLSSLSRIDAKRRIAVLGDMGELGTYSEGEHRELGKYIARAAVDRVYWLGAGGRHVRDGMGGSSGKTVQVFDTLHDVCAAVEKDIKSGDVVLVKASHAVGLERVVAHLLRAVLKEGVD
jgi:UDP-N-acetylmuramoyl-tripeptide--D-alanyl-D-alanine ligase